MADCAWCGEWMYEGKRIIPYDTCGKKECEREARLAAEDDRATRKYEAEKDDYSRY